ncbi:MAG: PAS domain S-box protein [Oculatellaceae cyanobacterium Prado106]|nr:PAS domain S-box protein [Oculatellaceae cyanobacterium Prado106]
MAHPTAQLQQENQRLHTELLQLQQDYERLQKSEARYRQVVENAPISILFIDSQGCIPEMNRAAEQLYGLSLEQLNEQACPIFENPQLVENGTLPYMRQAFAGEAAVESPTYYDASRDSEGGKFHYGQGHYAPIWNAAGEVEEIVEITANVSHVFELQEQLLQERDRATQERIHILSTIAQVANLLLSSSDYTTVLSEVVQLLGEAVGSDRCSITQDVVSFDSQEAIAARLLQEWDRAGVLPSSEILSEIPIDDEAMQRIYQRFVQGETVNLLTTEAPESLRTILEMQRITSILIVPILVQGKCWGQIGFDNCGEPRLFDEAEIAILRIAADSMAAAIARQHKEEALRKSEALYRSLFEISNEGIYRVEYNPPISLNLSVDEQVEQIYHSYQVVQANDAFAAMYGMTQGEEMLGVKLTDVHVENSEKNLKFIRSLVENHHQIRSMESEEVDFNGQRRYFLNSVIGFMDGDAEQERSQTLQQLNGELQAAIAQLSESEERYHDRTLNENAIAFFLSSI